MKTEHENRKYALAGAWALYLDYLNNFLSVARFAEYYNLPLDVAEFILETGRRIGEHEINLQPDFPHRGA